MLAALLTAHNAPLHLAEVEPLSLAPGQVLVKILVSGICGKQLGEVAGSYDERAPLPRLIGHEGCGIVEQAGPGVTKVKEGEKVVCHWRKGSGMDSAFPRYGYGGQVITSGRITTFSEYAIVSENRLTAVPQETPNELCALLGCGLSTALGVMENEAQLKMGESVLVLGCGGVGMNLLKVARLMHAGWITGLERDSAKLQACIQNGAMTAGVKLPNSKDGYNVIVDTTGDPETIESAAALLAPSGRFIMLSQPKAKCWFPAHGMSMFEGEGKRLIATQGGGFNPDRDLHRYIAMWKSGHLKIDGIVTHRYPLCDVNVALDAVRSGKAGRALLEMHT